MIHGSIHLSNFRAGYFKGNLLYSFVIHGVNVIKMGYFYHCYPLLLVLSMYYGLEGSISLSQSRSGSHCREMLHSRMENRKFRKVPRGKRGIVRYMLKDSAAECIGSVSVTS